MIATVDAVNRVLTFVGDDATMQGHSHGGNDSLSASVEGFGDYVFTDGDAQSMTDHPLPSLGIWRISLFLSNACHEDIMPPRCAAALPRDSSSLD